MKYKGFVFDEKIYNKIKNDIKTLWTIKNPLFIASISTNTDPRELYSKLITTVILKKQFEKYGQAGHYFYSSLFPYIPIIKLFNQDEYIEIVKNDNKTIGMIYSNIKTTEIYIGKQ